MNGKERMKSTLVYLRMNFTGICMTKVENVFDIKYGHVDVGLQVYDAKIEIYRNS